MNELEQSSHIPTNQPTDHEEQVHEHVISDNGQGPPSSIPVPSEDHVIPLGPSTQEAIPEPENAPQEADDTPEVVEAVSIDAHPAVMGVGSGDDGDLEIEVDLEEAESSVVNPIAFTREGQFLLVRDGKQETWIDSTIPWIVLRKKDGIIALKSEHGPEFLTNFGSCIEAIDVLGKANVAFWTTRNEGV